MPKKAIITVSLVSEAEDTENEEIKKQIIEETSVSSIPFCAKIEKVEIKNET